MCVPQWPKYPIRNLHHTRNKNAFSTCRLFACRTVKEIRKFLNKNGMMYSDSCQYPGGTCLSGIRATPEDRNALASPKLPTMCAPIMSVVCLSFPVGERVDQHVDLIANFSDFQSISFAGKPAGHLSCLYPDLTGGQKKINSHRKGRKNPQLEIKKDGSKSNKQPRPRTSEPEKMGAVRTQGPGRSSSAKETQGLDPPMTFHAMPAAFFNHAGPAPHPIMLASIAYFAEPDVLSTTSHETEQCQTFACHQKAPVPAGLASCPVDVCKEDELCVPSQPMGDYESGKVCHSSITGFLSMPCLKTDFHQKHVTYSKDPSGDPIRIQQKCTCLRPRNRGDANNEVSKRSKYSTCHHMHVWKN